MKVHDCEDDDTSFLDYEVDREREPPHERASCLVGYDGKLTWRLRHASENAVQLVDELVTETGPLTLVPLRSDIDVTLGPAPDDK